jgi:hypothetical protein
MTAVAERFRAKVYDSNQHPWATIRTDIIGIHAEAFGSALTFEDLIKLRFRNHRATISLLTDDSEVAGFSIAVPVGQELVRRDNDTTTAFVAPTAIRKCYRKQGLLPILLGTLDEELLRKGYEYTERYALIDEGYADTLQRAYGARVVYSRDFRINSGGVKNLRHLRIRLQ